MSKIYYKLKLLQVPSSQEELLSDLLFSNGAQGVSEVLDFYQEIYEYQPQFLEKEYTDLEAYFYEPPASSIFEYLQEHKHKFQLTEEIEKDWLEEWKKSFQPFLFVGDIWIVPPWLPAPKEAKLHLLIEPGLAFGTGTHATTYLASKLMVQNPNLIQNKSVMDVGCGTAVLALVAEKLAAREVYGIEIDEMARNTARENLELNQSKKVTIYDALLQNIEESYDVVLANIIDGVLVELKNDLLKITKPQGYLILSGILKERESYFEEKFLHDARLKVITKLEKEEWLGYLVQKL